MPCYTIIAKSHSREAVLMFISDRNINNQQLFHQLVIDRHLNNISVTDSDISDGRLISADIQAMKLIETTFNYCRADDCRFRNLSLDHCLAQHGFYHKCHFVDFSAHSSFLTGTSFVDCLLENTVSELNSFGLCVFENSLFANSRMSEVSFIASLWRNCELRDESYNFVRFPSAVFTDTRFVGCKLRKVIFRRARFIRCRFENCQLPEAVFHNAEFTDTVFENTDIYSAANLEGVKGLDL